MKEELGVIEDADFGLRDAGKPVLWFTVITIYSRTLQMFGMDEMCPIIQDAGVYKISDLNGLLCIVNTDGTIVKFLRMYK